MIIDDIHLGWLWLNKSYDNGWSYYYIVFSSDITRVTWWHYSLTMMAGIFCSSSYGTLAVRAGSRKDGISILWRFFTSGQYFGFWELHSGLIWIFGWSTLVKFRNVFDNSRQCDVSKFGSKPFAYWSYVCGCGCFRTISVVNFNWSSMWYLRNFLLLVLTGFSCVCVADSSPPICSFRQSDNRTSRAFR